MPNDSNTSAIQVTASDASRSVTSSTPPDTNPQPDEYKTAVHGGSGGNPFDYYVPGQKVAKLQTWSQGHHRNVGNVMDFGPCRLRGILITLQNGETMQAGKDEGEQRVIELQEDEKITDINVYVNPVYGSGRVALFNFTTNFGQTFVSTHALTNALAEAQDSDKEVAAIADTSGNTAAQLATKVPLGHYNDPISGDFMGVYGRDGSDIDAVGLILKVPGITKYVFSNIHYQTEGLPKQGTKPQNLSMGVSCNRAKKGDITSTFAFSHSQSHTRKWTSSKELKIGVTTTVSGGIPGIADIGTSISTDYSASFAYGESVTETTTDSATISVTTPARTAGKIIGTYTTAKIDVPYTADIEEIRSDGTTKTYKGVKGIYNGVDVSELAISVDPISIHDADCPKQEESG